MLQDSMKHAGHRCREVFTGIDIWGRGAFAGGGLNTYLGVNVNTKILEIKYGKIYFIHLFVFIFY